MIRLPLKCQAKFIADDIFCFNFSKKTSLDISCELSAKQTIIVCQADDSHEISRLVFFEKLKKNISKCCLL